MNNCEYDSIGILAHILTECASHGYEVSYTKAQKILFCCYGVVLAAFNLRLTQEHPKSWQYGPAFPRAFRAHHNNKINYSDDPFIKEGAYDPKVKDVVNRTIELFGKKTATALVNWTHAPGSPWDICSNSGKKLYEDIDDPIIKSYFKSHVIKDQQHCQ